MDYNYREAMRKDVRQAIEEKEKWIGKPITEVYEDKEEAYDQLFDDMWIDDSVTGNGSGSYTFNTYIAEEYLVHNWGLLKEALYEFDANKADILEAGAEWCDVTIRCYLLSDILMEVLENIFEKEQI